MTPDQIAELKRRADDGYMFRAEEVLALLSRIEALEAGLKDASDALTGMNVTERYMLGGDGGGIVVRLSLGVIEAAAKAKGRAANLLGDRHD